MQQAILTKYLRATNVHGVRVKAIAEAGSVTLSWDHALDDKDNHIAAAKALVEKYQWGGQWYAGALSGPERVFVCARTPAFNAGLPDRKRRFVIGHSQKQSAL